MANITFTIPDNVLPEVVQAIKKFNQIPLSADGQPQFTDNQWAKEAIRRLIVKWVFLQRRDTAVAAINVPYDDSVAS